MPCTIERYNGIRHMAHASETIFEAEISSDCYIYYQHAQPLSICCSLIVSLPNTKYPTV